MGRAPENYARTLHCITAGPFQIPTGLVLNPWSNPPVQVRVVFVAKWMGQLWH